MTYVMTVLPVFDPSCPFRSPASQFLDRTVQIASYYLTRLHRFIIRIILAVLALLWTPLLEASHHWAQRAGQILSISLHNSELLLNQKLRVMRLSEAEQEAIMTRRSDLHAQGLIWLSRIHDHHTEKFVIQAIASLSCETAAFQFNSDSFKGSYWPAWLLVEAYSSPTSGSSYHYELSDYAQAYLITLLSEPSPWMNVQKTQLICNALHWYLLGGEKGRPHCLTIV
ncbi:hypothetical protein BU17DRAFT_91055 [Hysterangium stoloniferum]|nr:hypothetical protein BU17DRAFT_91055 [Hysterangium stoloniferum]